MDAERHVRLFDGISKPYGWFFGYQVRSYTEIIRTLKDELPVSPPATALDVGCGTGAFAAALEGFGFSVQGVDGAPRMAAAARARGIPCEVGQAASGLSFADRSFDLVCAAYVAHGLERDDRMKLYREMRRIARGAVLYHDYAPEGDPAPRFPLIPFLEMLERSDYRGFIRTACSEMREVFGKVRVVPVTGKLSWYVCG